MMIDNWTEYTRFIVALFVILNPFFVVPIYLGLTKGYSTLQRNKVVLMACITVCIVLVLSALAGETLLLWMGTSLGAFRVGGGIVLFLMAVAMLQAQPDPVRTTETEQEEIKHQEGIALVPLAIPLLAGPGAISSSIIAMQRSTSEWHGLFIILSIVIVCVILWGLLRVSPWLEKTLGATGLNVINRIFGLILAAIAVEVTSNGLKQLFPVLAGG